MTVRRRRVLYIPGYDPFHPRRYRELYRREGAAQAALSGYRLAQRKGDGSNSWIVEAEIDGAQVETRFEVLVWSDIVAASMSAGVAAIYIQMLRTAWIYTASGAFFRLVRLRKGPVIAALYPVAILLLQLVLALALGVSVYVLVTIASELALRWIEGPGFFLQSGLLPRLILAAFAGLCAVWAALRSFKARDNKVFAHYLMHDYAFTARWRGAYPAELEERLRTFRDRIVDALASDADEVLIVGHSSGVHLAISALADLVRERAVPREACAFLSLGQVVPMVSFLSDANRLRRDLHVLAGQTPIIWLDVTAPGDGCSFALCDPVAVSGIAPAHPTGPLVISAAFTRTLSPARWKALRWRWFRLHFQYLCAFDALPGRVDDYDYFRITAGPMTLRDRFAGRSPSPSVRRDSLNPNTTMAP